MFKPQRSELDFLEEVYPAPESGNVTGFSNLVPVTVSRRTKGEG